MPETSIGGNVII